MRYLCKFFTLALLLTAIIMSLLQFLSESDPKNQINSPDNSRDPGLSKISSSVAESEYPGDPTIAANSCHRGFLQGHGSCSPCHASNLRGSDRCPNSNSDSPKKPIPEKVQTVQVLEKEPEKKLEKAPQIPGKSGSEPSNLENPPPIHQMLPIFRT